MNLALICRQKSKFYWTLFCCSGSGASSGSGAHGHLLQPGSVLLCRLTHLRAGKHLQWVCWAQCGKNKEQSGGKSFWLSNWAWTTGTNCLYKTWSVLINLYSRGFVRDFHTNVVINLSCLRQSYLYHKFTPDCDVSSMCVYHEWGISKLSCNPGSVQFSTF